MLCEWIACDNKTNYNKKRKKYNRFCSQTCIRKNHRHKDKQIIVGHTRKTCVNPQCKKTYLVSRVNQIICGLSDCKKYLKNKESIIRRRNNKRLIVCSCGNTSHNQFGKNKLCLDCIKNLIKKTNWIILSEIPEHYNKYIKVECKTCRLTSEKQVSHLTNNNSADKNCNNCSRANVSTHYNKSDKGYFYLLENDLFYKYGVSYRIDERIAEHKRSKLYPYLQIEFNTLQQAYQFEKLVKDFIKENKLEYEKNYNFVAGGKTETICKSKTNNVTAKWLMEIIKEKE